MSNGMKKMTVQYRTDHPDGKPRWLVVKCGGHIDYNPGDILNKDCMTDLCRMYGVWDITIIGGEKEKASA